jgi:hypothetical protein
VVADVNAYLFLARSRLVEPELHAVSGVIIPSSALMLGHLFDASR